MREMKDSGIEWINYIPKSWGKMRLKDVAVLKTGKTPSTSVPEWFDGDLIWYTPGDFNNIDLRESSRTLSGKAEKDNVAIIVPPDSVMIIGIGGTAGKVAYTLKECSCNQQITALISKDNVNARFLLYYMYICSEILKATALYTTLPIINNQFLGNWFICIGDRKEQDSIAKHLDKKCSRIDALSAEIQSEIDTLEAYKQSVITEYVTKGLDKNAPMKDSGIEWIGEIPKHWEMKKIKYTLLNRTENNNPVRTTNILSLTAKQGVIPLEEREGGGNKPKEDFSAYRLAYPNDIVMNSMNILSGSVGLSKHFGCVSPVYYMLRPKEKEDDVRYYHDVFQTRVFQKSLRGLGNGILIKESENGNLNTIRMRIPMDTLGNIIIPVPPSTEQKKIADYIDEKISDIDIILTQKQKQLEVLADYKKSVIYEYVTGKKEVPAL